MSEGTISLDVTCDMPSVQSREETGYFHKVRDLILAGRRGKDTIQRNLDKVCFPRLFHKGLHLVEWSETGRRTSTMTQTFSAMLTYIRVYLLVGKTLSATK